MRILHINSLYPPIIVGGAELSVASLARAQAARGHEVHTLSLHQSPTPKVQMDGPITVHRIAAGAQWPFAPRRGVITKMRWHLRDALTSLFEKEITAIVTTVRPDVVHTHNMTGLSLSAWRICGGFGKPVVHTPRDYTLLCPRATMFKNGHNCRSVCLSCRPFAMTKMRHSLSVGAVIGTARLITGIHLNAGFFANAKFSRVLGNLIETDVRPPRDGGAVASNAALPRRFVFIGRPSREKGFDFIVDTLKSLERSDWVLDVYGNKPADLLETDSRVVFKGFYPAKEIFASSNFTVLVPSLWREPFSRVVAEACAYGIPIIASDIAGPEEILDQYRTGTLVEMGNKEAWRAALMDVIEGRGPVPSDGARLVDPDPQSITDRSLEAYTLLINSGAGR